MPGLTEIHRPQAVNTDSLAEGRRTAVLHIEDDPLWHAAIGRSIRQWPEFRMVGTATTGADGIALCRDLSPAIVILDLRLPDIDGFSVLQAIRTQAARPRVLLLSCRNDEVALHHGMSSDVSGMLLKSADYDRELRTALTTIAAGRRFYSDHVRAEAARFRNTPLAFHKLLSGREIEVLKLIAAGQSDEEIAAWLGLSRATAHSHRQRIMAKLGIHSSAKLMAWAREKGFV